MDLAKSLKADKAAESLVNYALSRAYTSDDGFRHYLRDILGYMEIYDPFHAPIIDAVADFNTEKRMIQAFRGSYKSSIGTIGLATWMIAREYALLGTCNIRILIGSEVLELAQAFVRSIMQIMEFDDTWRDLFGDHRGDRKVRKTWTDKQFMSRYKTKHTLKEYTVSTIAIDAPRTGHHYDVLLMDDLEAERSSATRDIIDKVDRFWQLTVPLLNITTESHLTNTPSGIPVIKEPIRQITCTRWHHDDIYTRILKRNEFAPEDEKYRVIIQPVEVDGVPTFPSIFPEKKIDAIKMEMSTYHFNCQYMLNPSSDEERQFKKEWFQPIPQSFTLTKNLRFFTSVDMAYTEQFRIDTGELKKADYTTVFTVAVDSFWNYYIVEWFRSRVDKKDAIIEMMRQAKKFKSQRTVLQKFDRSLIDDVIRQHFFDVGERINYEYVSYPTRQKKNDRIEIGLQPLYKAGKIFHCAGLEWYEEELETFPNSVTDDGMDNMCNVVAIAQPAASSHYKPVKTPLVRHVESLHKKGRKLTLAGDRYDKGDGDWKHFGKQ